ncbi:MAG TPA: hypothetical protein VGV89_06530 [Thermoplasmata archaeon]|nr:hypothetical protein [Thermoplasmata archaeon]
MIRARPDGVRGVEIVGVVRGIAREAVELSRVLEETSPEVVALALSTEEAQSLTEHFVQRPTEPFVPLLGSETVEIRELSRYGEVRVPHPAFLEALEWAKRRNRRIVPVDPSEERYAEMFAEEIGYFELVRRTLREKRLLRSPPKAPDADGFILDWDRILNRGGGSRRLQRRREAAVAEALRSLAPRARGISCVIDRERVPALLAALEAPVSAN